MEIIDYIIGWSYPAIDLALALYCFIKVKNEGGKFLAMGFSLEFISSLTSRIMWEFIRSEVLNQDTYMNLQAYLGWFYYLAYIGFAVLLIIGISKLTNQEYQSVKDESILTESAQNLDNVSLFGNVILYTILLSVGLVFCFGGYLSIDSIESETIAIIMIIIGGILLISAWIYYLVMFYRVWKFSISQSNALNLIPSIETPGKAIGFLFIPIVGFFWMFKAYGKLPRDLNEIAQVKNLEARMSEGLGIAMPILAIIGFIPIVGYVSSIISSLIIAPIFMSQAIRLSKRIFLLATD